MYFNNKVMIYTKKKNAHHNARTYNYLEISILYNTS